MPSTEARPTACSCPPQAAAAAPVPAEPLPVRKEPEPVAPDAFSRVIDQEGNHSLKYDTRVSMYKHEDTLPLWIADCDWPVPAPVQRAIQSRVAHPIYGYTNCFTPEYYDSIRGWFHTHHNWDLRRGVFTYAPGVLHSIVFALEAFTSEGDGVIIQRPVYPPFTSIIGANKRVVVNNPLVYDPETRKYHMDFDDLEAKAADPKTKMMILCSPHNPVGRIWTLPELRRVGEICQKHNLILICDEIHCDTAFPGRMAARRAEMGPEEGRHHPFHTVDPAFKKFSIICSSGSKTFNIAGLYCSFAVIDDDCLRLRMYEYAYNRHFMQKPCMLSSLALQEAYSGSCDAWYAEMLKHIESNFEFTKEFCARRLKKVVLAESEGTYLAWMDFRGYGLTREALNKVIYAARVGLQDGWCFGAEGEGWQRLCLGTTRALLTEALTRIADQFVAEGLEPRPEGEDAEPRVK